MEPLKNSRNELTVPEEVSKVFPFVRMPLSLTVLYFLFCVLQSNDMTNLPLEFTGIKLNDLNDYCLLQIFQSKTLDLYDICSLADTCKRFRQITQWIAPKELECRHGYKKDDYYNIRLRIMDFREAIGKGATHFLDKPCPFATIKRIFEIFGPNLASVLTSSQKDNTHCHLTDQVALHCKDSLKHLSLEYQQFNQCQAVEMQPIFKKLTSLKFFSVHLFVNVNLFAGMDSLVELELACVNNGIEILENTFPKLERFTYGRGIQMRHRRLNLHERELIHVLSAFIVRHKGLKYLNFYGSISEKSAVKFSQSIVQNCTQLDTLFLRYDTTRTLNCIKILTQLKSLKNLYLEHQSYSHLEIFAPMKQLRNLNLTNCGLPLDLNQFDAWAHLTKIYLTTPDDFRSFDVVGVIEHLTNIEELELYSGGKYVLDEATVRKIVRVVCGRLQLLRLKCLYDFDWREFDAGEKLKLLQTFTFGK